MCVGRGVSPSYSELSHTRAHSHGHFLCKNDFVSALQLLGSTKVAMCITDSQEGYMKPIAMSYMSCMHIANEMVDDFPTLLEPLNQSHFVSTQIRHGQETSQFHIGKISTGFSVEIYTQTSNLSFWDTCGNFGQFWQKSQKIAIFPRSPFGARETILLLFIGEEGSCITKNVFCVHGNVSKLRNGWSSVGCVSEGRKVWYYALRSDRRAHLWVQSKSLDCDIPKFEF